MLFVQTTLSHRTRLGFLLLSYTQAISTQAKGTVPPNDNHSFPPPVPVILRQHSSYPSTVIRCELPGPGSPNVSFSLKNLCIAVRHCLSFAAFAASSSASPAPLACSAARLTHTCSIACAYAAALSANSLFKPAYPWPEEEEDDAAEGSLSARSASESSISVTAACKSSGAMVLSPADVAGMSRVKKNLLRST